MKGASVEVAIWSFFSRQGLYFHHTKNQPPLRPPSTFSEHWPWFWQYLLYEKFTKKIWYKIWVITILKSAKFLASEGYWKRNKSLLLTFFLTFKNPIGPLALWCGGSVNDMPVTCSVAVMTQANTMPRVFQYHRPLHPIGPHHSRHTHTKKCSP